MIVAAGFVRSNNHWMKNNKTQPQIDRAFDMLGSN
jgi:hypothetical protein